MRWRKSIGASKADRETPSTVSADHQHRGKRGNFRPIDLNSPCLVRDFKNGNGLQGASKQTSFVRPRWLKKYECASVVGRFHCENDRPRKSIDIKDRNLFKHTARGPNLL